MPTVNQLPTLTSWGATGSNPNTGKDVAGAYLDKDGTTAWLFQYFGNGFAHVNLSANSIVFQGNWFNVSGSNITPVYSTGGNTPLWIQDDNNHYYTATSTFQAENPFGSGHVAIYKTHVGTGVSTDFGNGHLVTDATLDGGTFTPALDNTAAGFVQDWLFFTSGGVRYGAIIGKTGGWVINLDTMAYVGGLYRITDIPASITSTSLFFDGVDVWFVLSNSAATDNVTLLQWKPSDGMFDNGDGTFSLNYTNWFTTITIDGRNGISFATYVSSIPAALLANAEDGYAGSVTLLTMPPTMSIVTTHFNDKTFFSSFSDAPASAFAVGVQSGVLAIPGDVTPGTSQVGGIVNVINPANLTLTLSYDITNLIDSAGGAIDAVPTKANSNRDVRTVTSASADGVHATYICNNDYVVGQLVVVSGCTPTSLNTANSNSPDTITAASATQFSVAKAVTVSTTSQASASAGLTVTVPVAFANMRFSAAESSVLVTYTAGSPAYWITGTPSAPFSPPPPPPTSVSFVMVSIS